MTTAFIHPFISNTSSLSNAHCFCKLNVTRGITDYDDTWYPVSTAADGCGAPPSIEPYERLSGEEVGCAVMGPSVPAAAPSWDKSSVSSFCKQKTILKTDQVETDPGLYY